VSVLFLAVPVALLFVCGAAGAFLWASRSGQLDDLETPPLRMLNDSDGARAVPDAARGAVSPSPEQARG
jgi:cbb3-type cytochrome oxidase maturation protein